MSKYVDSHAHLINKYYNDLEDLINNIDDTIVIINGIDYESNAEILNIIDKKPNLYGALGIHPTDVDNHSFEELKEVFKKTKNKKVIAIGETGLDLYWDKNNLEKQKKFFKLHLDEARKRKKPVIIHSRGAEEEVYEILKDYKDVKSILHCFGGDLETAEKFIGLGALIGIGGVVTFKNAKELQKIVKSIDIENIITETDSPFLSPEPNRGKRNEPSNIKYIVRKIADLKGLNDIEVKEAIYKNFKRQFDLK